MAVGGNQRARTFFKQHGWEDIGADKIEPKYTSRAAQLYRAQLAKDAAKFSVNLDPNSPVLGTSGTGDGFFASIGAAPAAATAAAPSTSQGGCAGWAVLYAWELLDAVWARLVALDTGTSARANVRRQGVTGAFGLKQGKLHVSS